MINFFVEMFSFPFMVRAFVVGTLIALCSSLLGVSLILKRYSMIGDGLSHVGFGAIALAKVFSLDPLATCIPVVTASSILLLRLKSSSKIKGDAATALISTAALALGVMVISVTTGMNTDVCNYLFGSILSMSRTDVHLSIGISIAVIFMFILFYNRIFAVTFDETFAAATGTKTKVFNFLIAILTSLVIVVGMRMIGALLISSLIVVPALGAMRVCKKFKSVVFVSAIISVLCLWCGLIVSYQAAFPTGASIVCCDLIVFSVLTVISKVKAAR